MSSVIAFRDDNGVQLAGDRFVGNEYLRHRLSYPKVLVKNGIGFGLSGSLMDLNLLKYAMRFEPIKSIDNKSCESYVTNEVVGNWRKVLMENGRVRKDSEILLSESYMVVVVGTRIFNVGFDFGVMEIENDFACVGYNSEMKEGALSVLKDIVDMSTREKLIRAFEIEEDSGNYVCFPIDIIDVNTGVMETIYKNTEYESKFTDVR